MDRYIRMEIENSSCIRAFNYDRETEILRIEFIHGGTYDYEGVPEDIIRRWMKADSKGKFFNKEIRYGYAN